MKRLGAVTAALLVLTAGCGANNTDPRKGRVTVDESDCFFGSCFIIWEICQGPDLLVHNSDAEKENRERLFRDSPECAE